MFAQVSRDNDPTNAMFLFHSTFVYREKTIVEDGEQKNKGWYWRKLIPGNWRDDHHRRQKSGRENQLLRIQGNNVYHRKPSSQSWKQCLSKETTITILVIMSIKGNHHHNLGNNVYQKKPWSQSWKEMQVMLGAIPLLIPDPPPSGAKAVKPKEWKRAEKNNSPFYP